MKTTPYHREESEDFQAVMNLYVRTGSLRLDVLFDKEIDVNSVGFNSLMGESNLLAIACARCDANAVDAVKDLLLVEASPHPVATGRGNEVLVPPAILCLDSWFVDISDYRDPVFSKQVWDLLLLYGMDAGQKYDFTYVNPHRQTSAWDWAQAYRLPVQPHASILKHGYDTPLEHLGWTLSGERLNA